MTDPAAADAGAQRWLITGGGGQLATHASELLTAAGTEHTVLDMYQLDITDADAVEACVAEQRPDVLLNAAAYTAVDAAEDDEATATAVNETGPRYLAEALARHGGRMLHVSTDYVFRGDARRPYEVGDPVDPQNAYGRTKLAGEQAVLLALPDRTHVVRTAWIYGGPSANFVDTMLRLEGERDTLTVVTDQRGCPTWVRDLAAGLIELGGSAVPAGVLHYVNSGEATWFDLAREIFRLVGADPERVHETDSTAFVQKATRPSWSVLSTAAWTAAGLTPPRPWQDALAAALTGRNAARPA